MTIGQIPCYLLDDVATGDSYRLPSRMRRISGVGLLSPTLEFTSPSRESALPVVTARVRAPTTSLGTWPDSGNRGYGVRESRLARGSHSNTEGLWRRRKLQPSFEAQGSSCPKPDMPMGFWHCAAPDDDCCCRWFRSRGVLGILSALSKSTRACAELPRHRSVFTVRRPRSTIAPPNDAGFHPGPERSVGQRAAYQLGMIGQRPGACHRGRRAQGEDGIHGSRGVEDTDRRLDSQAAHRPEVNEGMHEKGGGVGAELPGEVREDGGGFLSMALRRARPMGT